MNRRSFLTAIAAVAAAPQLGRRLLAQAATEVRPFFLYRDNSLAHTRAGRWYVYPVSVPAGGGLAVRSESDDLIPYCSGPRYIEVRSDRPLTSDEVRARAREMLA